MTHSKLLKIGDEVVFKVDPQYREFTKTYEDIPDGTKGVVCNFYDTVVYVPRIPVLGYQPGVYHHKGAVSVWLPDGRIVPAESFIEMVDRDEEVRRNATFSDVDGVLSTRNLRLGDLPETKFWEQDKVHVRFPNVDCRYETVIESIDYNNMHKHRNDGSPWPFYNARFMGGVRNSIEESWGRLVERGNVWKYYHNEPLSFADLKEEAQFFQLIGQTEDVRNSTNDTGDWTKGEVLDAVKKGIVHGFLTCSGFFGSGVCVSAQRFKDEEVGKRVAEETLKIYGSTT